MQECFDIAGSMNHACHVERLFVKPEDNKPRPHPVEKHLRCRQVVPTVPEAWVRSQFVKGRLEPIEDVLRTLGAAVFQHEAQNVVKVV